GRTRRSWREGLGEKSSHSGRLASITRRIDTRKLGSGPDDLSRPLDIQRLRCEGGREAVVMLPLTPVAQYIYAGGADRKLPASVLTRCEGGQHFCVGSADVEY